MTDFQVKRIQLPDTESSVDFSYTEATNEYPDVYYIILDAYARGDILQEKFGFDNSEFLHFLEERDFYVATESSSNYAQTYLSVATSLNVRYLDDLIESVDQNSDDRTALRDLIVKSSVIDDFKNKGYTFVTFSSGYTATEEHPKSDIYYSLWFGLNHFEQRLINISLIRRFGIFLNLDLSKAARERFLYNITKLKEVPENPKPTFTFLHVLHPHPPFIFGPNGEVQNTGKPYTLNDGNDFLGTDEEYKVGYTSQLTYINKTMMDVIQHILQNSEVSPIIILQSDHGSGQDTYWEEPNKTDVRERMSNLTAIRAPESIKTHLYSKITPVNIFRIIENEILGSEFELLEDKSYFSTLSKPYKLYPVVNNQVIIE